MVHFNLNKANADYNEIRPLNGGNDGVINWKYVSVVEVQIYINAEWKWMKWLSSHSGSDA